MKVFCSKLKPIAFSLASLMMLQSCVAYQETPVSLQQGEQSKTRVKVNTISNQTYRFEQIVLEEDQFYGLKKEKGEIVKIAIHNNEHNKVFLHSKKKSTWKTITAIAIPVIGLIILRSSITFNAGDIFEE